MQKVKNKDTVENNVMHHVHDEHIQETGAGGTVH